jgi:hypothetical protein
VLSASCSIHVSTSTRAIFRADNRRTGEDQVSDYYNDETQYVPQEYVANEVGQDALDEVTQTFFDDPIGHVAAASQIAAQRAVEQYRAETEQQRWRDAIEQGDLRTEHVRGRMRERFADYDRFEQQAAQLIEANPAMFGQEMFTSQRGIEQALEGAYRICKGVADESAGSDRWERIMSVGDLKAADILSGEDTETKAAKTQQQYEAWLRRNGRA